MGRHGIICIKPSLAIGIDALGHTIRVCEGGEAEGGRQSCRHMYAYIEPCACLCGRVMQIL